MLCPKCGTDNFAVNANPSGLVTWTQEPNGEIAVNLQQIFPVRAFFCQSCGYVELKYEKPTQK